MSQLRSFWSRLDNRRRLVVGLATVVMFAAILMLARLAAAPSLALLYAGLDPAAAGAVIQALDQRGVTHEVRGDSLWVDARRRDALRMELAADGLPANGGAGYELLDQLSGFGTTARMFDAAYLRAKEGELARTIAASPFVRSARVHLAVPDFQPFRRDLQPSASLSIVATSGAITVDQAQAIRHLVAASVPGLASDQVTVIDSRTGLIPVARAGIGGGEGRAEELRLAVERLLAARVGIGRAQVEVAVDVITDHEAITERRFDPQGRVIVATESEERSNSATGTAAGVTVASNLPEGDAARGDSGRSQGSETRERINYEVSETARELVRSPGGIRRLTVAALVDGVRSADGGWQARTAEELADLRELIAAAVGFDADRGDVITIKSLEFEPYADHAGVAGGGWLAALDPMALVQMAVLVLLVLSVVFFVIRPLLRPARPVAALPLPLAPPAPLAGVALTGVVEPVPDAEAMIGAQPSLAGGDLPEDPVARLRRLIAERQTESLAILQGWMEEHEESGT